MTIQYDGTNYFGWQRQKKGPTIQAQIEESLRKIFKKEIKIRGAGRTDAGVHALAQIATFKVDLNFPLHNLKKALNALLPSDIKVTEVEEFDKNFHPQYSVKSKSYVYYLYQNEYCSPFIQRYVWHYVKELNLNAIQKAKELFIGKFDFTAFSGRTTVKDKVRTVYSLTVEPSDTIYFLDMKIKGNFIKFRIEANGFLKYMARNIVGALVELGKERLTEETLKEALTTGNRPNSLRTAPPQGLFLERIIY